MADVNVKRVGRGIPERRRLYGKRRLPVGLSLAGLRPLVRIGGCCFTESADFLSAFPWRASARWCALAASCRRMAVRVGDGGRHRACCWSGRFRSRLPFDSRLTSEGMPMPTSVLRKQAQPGGRKRSARAVNGGPDGRRERQASGRGYSRAAAAALRKDWASCRRVAVSLG